MYCAATREDRLAPAQRSTQLHAHSAHSPQRPCGGRDVGASGGRDVGGSGIANRHSAADDVGADGVGRVDAGTSQGEIQCQKRPNIVSKET